MIGFSLDIDLTAVFPRLSRHLPAYLATYEPVRRNIATETAWDGRREEPYRLRADVYLNLKLEEIDLEPRSRLRVPSSSVSFFSQRPDARDPFPFLESHRL